MNVLGNNQNFLEDFPPPPLSILRTYGEGIKYKFPFNVNLEQGIELHDTRIFYNVTRQCIGEYDDAEGTLILNGTNSLDHLLNGSIDQNNNRCNAIYMYHMHEGAVVERCIRPHGLLPDGTIITSPTSILRVVVGLDGRRTAEEGNHMLH